MVTIILNFCCHGNCEVTFITVGKIFGSAFITPTFRLTDFGNFRAEISSIDLSMPELSRFWNS
jgi:hypothetical protein